MDIEMTELLLAFGFFWILVAALLGLIQGMRHTGHGARLESVAEAGDLVAYNREFTTFRRNTTTHTHSMLFALLTLTIAVVLQVLQLVEADAMLIGSTLIGATVIWTLGGLLNIKAVKGAGDLLLVGGVLLTLFRVVENGLQHL